MKVRINENKDVSQKKLIKQLQLEEENCCLINVIDSIPGSIYWKDRNGVYLGRNLYAAQKSHSVDFEKAVDKNDIIGKTDYDYISKETADLYRKHDLEVMRTGKELILEENITLPNGEKLNQLSYKKPLRNKSGEIVGIIGNTIDITALKRAEEAADSLRKENAIIEVKRKTIASLASSIAHEVGNLLMGINAYASNLISHLRPKTICLQESKEEDKKLSLYLSKLEKSLKNANYMFTLLKMNIKGGEISKEQFVIANIGDDIEGVLVNCFPSDEVVANIQWNKEDNFDYIGIPAYTRSILLNLIKNALYFIKEEGKGSICIKLKKGKAFNELIFQDTAKGIESSLIPKIFSNISTTRNGSGMGLPFCRTVMQNYGGDIVCESELDVHATFILTFPVINIDMLEDKFKLRED